MVTGAIAFGSLSHGHLSQLFKNVLARICVLEWNVPGIVDSQGCLSVHLLRGVDADFASAVESGLHWEILSYKMDIEEPDASAVIAQALNKKNEACMFAHEMEAMSRMASLTASSAVAEFRLSWQAAQAKIRLTLPQFADDPAFIDMFAFVVNLGGSDGGYLQDLFYFHEKFVDATVRRMSLSALEPVNLFPLEFPRLKVAAVKFMYSEQPIRGGFCVPLSSKQLKPLLDEKAFRDASVVTEELLQFVHHDCQAAISTHAQAVAVKFYGNLDKDLFKALLSEEKVTTQRIIKIRSVGKEFHARLATLTKGAVLPPMTWAVSADSTSVVTGPSSVALQPRIIRFVDGKPQSQQDVLNPCVVERLNWSSFMATQPIVDAIRMDEAKASVASVLHRMFAHWIVSGQEQTCVQRCDGALSQQSNARIGVSVLAAKDLPVGSMYLVPAVAPPAVSKVLAWRANAPGVVVKVSRDGAPLEFATVVTVCGSNVFPKVAPAADVDDHGHKTRHEWSSNHFVNPFWSVQRVVTEAEANCALQTMIVRTINTFSNTPGQGDPQVDNFDVHVPIIVNSVAIPKDSELVVYWPKQKVATASGPKTKTWESAAKVAFKAHLKSAGSS